MEKKKKPLRLHPPRHLPPLPSQQLRPPPQHPQLPLQSKPLPLPPQHLLQPHLPPSKSLKKRSSDPLLLLSMKKAAAKRLFSWQWETRAFRLPSGRATKARPVLLQVV